MLKPDTEAYIPSVVESKWQKKWKDPDLIKNKLLKNIIKDVNITNISLG